MPPTDVVVKSSATASSERASTGIVPDLFQVQVRGKLSESLNNIAVKCHPKVSTPSRSNNDANATLVVGSVTYNFTVTNLFFEMAEFGL